MVQAEPFDFDSLREEIVAAAQAAFAEVSAREAPNAIVAFALYSDDGAMTVCPAMATAAYMEAIAGEGEALYLKYSPSEWPLEGVGADHLFGPICDRVRNHVFALEDIESDDGGSSEVANEAEFERFKNRLMQTCVESAERLRAGCFAAMDDDFIVLVTISDGDEPVQELNERVARLNAPAIAQEHEAWTRSWGTY
jgi:hypothetical protein